MNKYDIYQKIKVPLSFGQWDRNGSHSKRVKRLTFSIFLCGCKLSGTISSANLSTLSAAKLQKISKSVISIIINNAMTQISVSKDISGAEIVSFQVIVLESLVGGVMYVVYAFRLETAGTACKHGCQ